MKTRAALMCGLAMTVALTGAANAFEFNGEKALLALTRDGQRTRIGSVFLEPTADGHTRFRVKMDTAVMRDHFLSMREFKCLPAAVEISCHVPYPYRQPGTLRPDQLAWLEHSLLFFYKQPADFGAKLWNGIIYQFKLAPTGLVGTPQAVDLNAISAPPAQLDTPPFGPGERSDMTPGARWISELHIE